MASALIYFGGSVFLLTTLTVLFKVEDSYGDRLLLSGLRTWLDRKVIRFKASLATRKKQGTFNYIRLSWHYLIHTLLKRIKLVLLRLETWSDGALKRNKEVAKEIRKARTHSHFEEISAHKEKVALTEEERAERKSH